MLDPGRGRTKTGQLWAYMLGAGAESLTPELGDLQLEVHDHRLGCACPGLGVGQLRFRFVGSPDRYRQQRLERFNVVRQGRNGGVHGCDGIT